MNDDDPLTSDEITTDRGRGREWRRRHAETKSSSGMAVVRAEPPEEDWSKRHGRCPRAPLDE